MTNTYINNKMKLRRLIQGKTGRFEPFQVYMVRGGARIEVQGTILTAPFLLPITYREKKIERKNG